MIEPTDEMMRAYNDARAALNQEQMHARPPIAEEVKQRAGLAAVLAIVERDQSEELALLRGLFEIQSRRMAAATAMWRSEDPVARAHTLPDLGDLLGWLMSKIDAPQLTHRDGIDG